MKKLRKTTAIVKHQAKTWLPSWLIPNIAYKLNEDPYYEHFDRHECIFIHIPKTAGLSVSEALFGVETRGHRSTKEYKIYNPDKFEKYFKFAFVRNPWDRLVSSFEFLKKGGMNELDQYWSQKYISQFDNFEEFVQALTQKSFAHKVLALQHFRSQYKYICDPDDNIEVDFVGKFENLQQDFEKVKRTLGVEASLPHKNRTPHKEYPEKYDSRTKKIVEELYKKDIELFNYKFKNKPG